VISKNLGIVLLGMAATMSLLSCAAIAPDSRTAAASVTQSGEKGDLRTIYSDLGKAGGKVFTLDPQSSAVRIYAYRAGPAAKLAHNHVLAAPQFTGFFQLPPGGASSGRFDLEFRLDQLEIDNPAHRSALGSAFASVLSPAFIESTREHMLGEENMQADRFPFVRVHSLQIAGDSPKFAARVQIEMHGQKREMWIPLNVEGLPERLSVTGSFMLRQTDFGAQPYSVLGGLIAVQDEVVIEFKLVGA